MPVGRDADVPVGHRLKVESHVFLTLFPDRRCALHSRNAGVITIFCRLRKIRACSGKSC